MNNSEFNHDDPSLTAYALGEMEPAERAKFEQWLATNPEAQQAVEDIRATAAMLDTALAEEPAPAALQSAPPLEPAAIMARGDSRQPDGGAEPVDEYRKKRSKLLQFPALYYMTASLAAACFAVVFFTSGNHTGTDEKHLIALEPAMVDAMREQAAKAQAAKAVAEQDVRQREANAALQDATETITLQPFEVVIAGGAQPKAARVGDNMTVSGGGQPHPAPAARAAKVPAVTFGVSGGSRPMLARAPVSSLPPAGAEVTSSTEGYAQQDENPFLGVRQNPLSTFSVDVDTASYANVRRFLAGKQRPPKGAVRIEELVNYFPYRYTPPTGAAPFAASMEVASAPWAPEHRLVRIGLKGREVSDAARPRANLVFLLDVSGSMNDANKLPLVKQSMRLMLEKLRADDRVAIVVYAGASGLALPSTPVRERAKIAAAIDELRAGGSTNGAAGIQLAYDIAKANFVAGGVNRVVLATDGDFNVGVSSESELTELIQEKAQSGVFLSVLGFGMGNYKDSTLEKLADKGNGNYAYIDSLAEAKKTLVEQAGGTLVAIAKDVKLQVEFNPAVAQAYRLIGYENRMLRKEDFNNDKVDAGEIGAGHTVTALYEVVPVGVAMPEAGTVDALKYQRTDESARKTAASASGELLTLKVRYKEPAGETSALLEFPLRDSGKAFADASGDFKFAAAVAAFGMRLKNSPYCGETKLTQVAEWAREGIEDDVGGYRAEFVGLVNEAAVLTEE